MMKWRDFAVDAAEVSSVLCGGQGEEKNAPSRYEKHEVLCEKYNL